MVFFFKAIESINEVDSNDAIENKKLLVQMSGTSADQKINLLQDIIELSEK